MMLILVTGLVACAVAPKSNEIEPQAEVDKVSLDFQSRQLEMNKRRAKVRQLLSLAREALLADRLMRPAEANAYHWYQQVMVLDQANTEAHEGMQQITQRYLTLAKQAFTAGQNASAEKWLLGAEKVAATPAQTVAIRAQYRQQSFGMEFPLPVHDLEARNKTICELLAGLAVKIKARKLRMLIVARSDAEGRWIYKQMRSAVKGFRLRGNIEIGRIPSVVLID